MRTKLQEKFAQLARPKHARELLELLGWKVNIEDFSTLDELDKYRAFHRPEGVTIHKRLSRKLALKLIHSSYDGSGDSFEDHPIYVLLPFADDTGFIKTTLHAFFRYLPLLLNYELVIATNSDKSFGMIFDREDEVIEVELWGSGWEKFQ